MRFVSSNAFLESKHECKRVPNTSVNVFSKLQFSTIHCSTDSTKQNFG